MSTAQDAAPAEPADAEVQTPKKRSGGFPTAVTVLAIVTFLVWILALLIPSGSYEHDEYGAPVAGTYQEVDSPLSFGDRVRELVLSPVNGFYGLQDLASGFVSTENAGVLFGSIGVVVFILAMGSFMGVVFATRSLEVGIGGLAVRLRDRGWLLIVVIMAVFSLLAGTMGFSVETFGFYALLIPLMKAIGYDRMTTVGVIIVSISVGAMGSTVNPFSIGVASGEAGVSIGDGIVLRIVLWVSMTAIGIAYVLRYAQRVRRDPPRSLARDDDDGDGVADPAAVERLTGTQKTVLGITGLTFALLIFSVIPWASIFGATTGPAEADVIHETTTDPYWFQLDWWFPELAMLFWIAAIVIGIVARMGEKDLIGGIVRGAADFLAPALVIALARGVAVIMTNTQTLDTVLNYMERAVSDASAGVFSVLVAVVNAPLALLIPSSSGHATLAMPLLAPLSDFAGVDRALTITSWQLGHGLALMVAPTNVAVVAGLALAKVGYDAYLKFVAPLLGILTLYAFLVLFIAAGFG
ncbi:YfcC family protein [Jiangella alba]|uniref:Uncharacterized membrane protein YfcC, ion transporter superfamily n=1 Tax=Jiangella alba TaxID=561176 RepID=A0A1H5L9S9_9ACTN|nr:YfcC family protein [Jiangella alba]SEE73091.1 Uncharacterized membrane protein YfcC, ion transporter superfamily [Jiangella alba]